jgi:hypothetical protein
MDAISGRHPDDRQHFHPGAPAGCDGKKGCRSLSRSQPRRAHDQDPRRRRRARALDPARPDRRANTTGRSQTVCSITSAHALSCWRTMPTTPIVSAR